MVMWGHKRSKTWAKTRMAPQQRLAWHGHIANGQVAVGTIHQQGGKGVGGWATGGPVMGKARKLGAALAECHL